MINKRDSVLIYLKNMLMDADRIVCVTGHAVAMENGGTDIWENEELYRIEKEYGESPEELLAAGVFYSRTEQFYDFYCKEVLQHLPKPGVTIETLKRLQDMGRLKAVISMNMYGLEKQGGLENVIELQGSVNNAYCPHCRRTYPYEHLLSAAKVPVCGDCNEAIRPGIRLFGERVRNDYLTMATSACTETDVLMVLGTNLSGDKIQYCTGHYRGRKLVLINEKPHYSDRFADYVINEKPEEVFAYLKDEL